jgi:hypothetical protein
LKEDLGLLVTLPTYISCSRSHSVCFHWRTRETLTGKYLVAAKFWESDKYRHLHS